MTSDLVGEFRECVIRHASGTTHWHPLRESAATPPTAQADALRRLAEDVTRQLHGEGQGHRAGSWVNCPNRWCSGTRQIIHEAATAPQERDYVMEGMREGLQPFVDASQEQAGPDRRCGVCGHTEHEGICREHVGGPGYSACHCYGAEQAGGGLDYDAIADDVRYGSASPSPYWRGFNDGIDKLVARLQASAEPER